MNFPKQFFCFFILLFNLGHFFAQDYTWIHGSMQLGQAPIIGTPTIPAPANIPGARRSSVQWRDANGKLWLFGGAGIPASGNGTFLNDLWRYDPLTNQWAFMKGDSIGDQSGKYGTLGVSSSTNLPGGRYEAVSWVDTSGMLWMFGGYGMDANGQLGDLNDLWRFNPTSNQWTWMKGGNLINQTNSHGVMGVAAASNVPCGRNRAHAWSANGDLWLFGGFHLGYYCDLWKYSIASNNWTWVRGSSSPDQLGIYGTQGVSSASNNPGSRTNGAVWVDSNGNLYLFGGYGYADWLVSPNNMNDLWRYHIASNQWTWINGSNVAPGANGVYGTLGVPSASNQPGARQGAVTWADGSNNLWLFGGHAYAALGGDDMNDLWRYSISSGMWTWMKGGNMIGNAAVFGTLGVSAPQNTPGGKLDAAGWTDINGIPYFFGGRSYTTNTITTSASNDMWRLGSCVSQTLVISPSSTAICVGNTVNLSATGANSYSWSNSQTGSNINVNPNASTIYSVKSLDSLACYSKSSATVIVHPLPQLTITTSSLEYCVNDSVTLNAGGALTYTWANGSTGTTVTIPAQSTPIVLNGTDSNGCYNSTQLSLTVNDLPQLSLSFIHDTICAGETKSIYISGAQNYTWNPGGYTGDTLLLNPAATTIFTVTGQSDKGCVSTANLELTVDLCTGLKKEVDEPFHVFPNPFHKEIVLENKSKIADLKLEIYNALGQRVIRIESFDGSPVATESLENGLYVLRIFSKNTFEKEIRLIKD